MRSADGYQDYLSARDLPDTDREIIAGFIEQRNAVKPTATRTKGKQAYESAWIAETLSRRTADRARRDRKGQAETLASCTVHGLLLVAGEAGNGSFKKNSRQTKIMTLKVLARYIHRFHHEIPNLDLLTHDVKAGAAECNTKQTLSMEEWRTVINLPMPAREKAQIGMLYDGYHRPKEVLLLDWTDLQENKDGTVTYTILFKTELPRVIVQKPWATKLLRAWAKETGAVIGKTAGPIFPSPRTGEHYETIQPLADLFAVLRQRTGIPHLIPSVLRNTAIKHDVDAGLPVSYVCLRAWGVTYNKLINLYMEPDSGRIQADQHRKAVVADASPVVDAEEEGRLEKLQRELEELKRQQAIIQEVIGRKRAKGAPPRASP